VYVVVKKMGYKRKKLRSSSDSSASSQASSNSEYDSFPLAKDVTKTKGPERMELSSDSESSLIVARESRKKKKHRHGISDLERVHVIHSRHNGKRHRHRCHHHSHHRHGHSSKDEGSVHRRRCTKHKMSLEAVKITEEPLGEDSDRTRQSHLSHRRPEGRSRDKTEDGHGDQPVR